MKGDYCTTTPWKNSFSNWKTTRLNQIKLLNLLTRLLKVSQLKPDIKKVHSFIKLYACFVCVFCVFNLINCINCNQSSFIVYLLLFTSRKSLFYTIFCIKLCVKSVAVVILVVRSHFNRHFRIQRGNESKNVAFLLKIWFKWSLFRSETKNRKNRMVLF